MIAPLVNKATVKKGIATFAVAALALILLTDEGLSFQIEPKGTKVSRLILRFENWKMRITDKASPLVASFITDPIHERIAHQIYGCDGDHKDCSGYEALTEFAPAAVIAGAEWNDNPPFILAKSSMTECMGNVIQLPKYSVCWAKLLKDAEKRAKKGEVFDADSNAVLVIRVHFGDLQFLHSMASRDGEAPELTRQHILTWAEFTYRVATGDFRRDTILNQTGIDGMKQLFGNRGWTVQQLFTMGDPTYRKEQDLRDLAFGSLIHMVSDSFARSHADREEPTGGNCAGASEYPEPGRITNFHAYGRQDHKKHAGEDMRNALGRHLLSVQPNVVDVGKVLLNFYREGKAWPEVRGYLECVFALDDSATPSGPGELFVADEM